MDVVQTQLTPADLKKVDELLQRPYVNQQLSSELNTFKTIKFKAEIESILHFSIDYLVLDYIPRKIMSIAMPPVEFL
jgi:DNA topoisomerase VI subunit A